MGKLSPHDVCLYGDIGDTWRLEVMGTFFARGENCVYRTDGLPGNDQ